MDLAFLVHLACTCAMTGLVWFVQVVHYPLFAAVGHDRFTAYEALHTGQTGLVVIPLMTLEAMTGALLLWRCPAGVPYSLVAIGVALLAMIWASTFFVQVPLHQALSSGFEAEAHRRLVATNWLRTALWSLRAALLLWAAAGWRVAA